MLSWLGPVQFRAAADAADSVPPRWDWSLCVTVTAELHLIFKAVFHFKNLRSCLLPIGAIYSVPPKSRFIVCHSKVHVNGGGGERFASQL